VILQFDYIRSSIIYMNNWKVSLRILLDTPSHPKVWILKVTVDSFLSLYIWLTFLSNRQSNSSVILYLNIFFLEDPVHSQTANWFDAESNCMSSSSRMITEQELLTAELTENVFVSQYYWAYAVGGHTPFVRNIGNVTNPTCYHLHKSRVSDSLS
jgi:hypothetical protein